MRPHVFRPGELPENEGVLVIPARPNAPPEPPEAEAERRAEYRRRIGQQARGLIARAEREAARLKEEAEAYAARVRKEAEEEAAARVAKAEAEAAEVEAEARRRGFDAGYEEALAEGRAQAKEALARLTAIVAGAKAVRREALAAAEDGAVDVVLAVAKVLVLREIERDEDLIRRLLGVAAREVSATERVTLRVASRDLEAAPDLAAFLRNAIEGLREAEVVADPLIEPGGLVIETNFGRVDARLQSRLAEIERTLRQRRLADPAHGVASESAPTASEAPEGAASAPEVGA